MDELDREFLADMLRYAETAIQLLGDADEVDISADERTYLAVSRALQIIGEAANRVSAAARDELSEIPWPEVTGMRHHLVHGYQHIRAEILVSTIRGDLPDLIVLLRRALKDDDR